MGTRRAAREGALKLLYQLELTGVAGNDAAVAAFWEENPADADVEYYASLLVKNVQSGRAAIDEVIAAVVENWAFARIAPVERNILRLAVAEMLFGEDVPPKVAINEALELAKLYGSGPRAHEFVNGVLDAVYRRRRNGRD